MLCIQLVHRNARNEKRCKFYKVKGVRACLFLPILQIVESIKTDNNHYIWMLLVFCLLTAYTGKIQHFLLVLIPSALNRQLDTIWNDNFEVRIFFEDLGNNIQKNNKTYSNLASILIVSVK